MSAAMTQPFWFGTDPAPTNQFFAASIIDANENGLIDQAEWTAAMGAPASYTWALYGPHIVGFFPFGATSWHGSTPPASDPYWGWETEVPFWFQDNFSVFNTGPWAVDPLSLVATQDTNDFYGVGLCD